jgi:hypothetical protein
LYFKKTISLCNKKADADYCYHKRRKKIMQIKKWIMPGLACILLLSGCGADGTEGFVTSAMVLRDPAGGLYFVDTENGSFFTASVPEEITGVDGSAITEEDLGAGDLVEITGNGIMLESYPGQYPGVTRIAVTADGTEEDAQQYQELIDGVYVEPDPAEPPSMNVEYATELALTAVMLPQRNYEWSYVDENGEGQSVVACGSHILQSEELNEAKLDGPTDLRLLPSKEMESVEVTRWPESDWNDVKDPTKESNFAEGEAVEPVLEDGTWVIPGAESGYVYLVTGHWTEGYVEYGFHTT